MRSEGVQEYTTFYLTVNMPKGHEACRYCPGLKFDNDCNIRRCKFTWEAIPYPETSVGAMCMLIKEPELTEEENNESDC